MHEIRALKKGSTFKKREKGEKKKKQRDALEKERT